MESQNNYIENSQASNNNNDANSSQVDLHSEIKRLETLIAKLQQLITKKTPENAQQVINAKNNANAALTTIKATEKQATDTANAAAAQWKIVDQQVKSIFDLKSQASTDASTLAQYCKEIEEQKKEIAFLQQGFAQSYAEKENEINSLLKQIEKLLPGATSAGLASAFAKRRWSKFWAKILWGLLMVVSIALILCFGLMLLFPNMLSHWGIVINSIPGGTTLYGRMIILAGLVLLEEFSRRNFNISSRLEEAYAYKEVISRSYLGYKKQMEDIPWPNKTKEDPSNTSTSVLVSVFMNQLADDPSKNVFDKERHELGIGALFDLGTKAKNPLPYDAMKSLAEGKSLSKINWQTVVIVGIVAVAACFIAYMFKGQLL